MLADLTLGGFADEVGGPSPAPGGGSVAAYAGSMAASLVGMVCHLTAGKKGFEAREAELSGAVRQAEELKARLLAAVDVDTDAYLRVAGAYRLPKTTPDETAARAGQIAAATRAAAEVPLATAEACLEVLELARGVSAEFNTSAASDLGVAFQMALAGMRGAALNVEINLQYLAADAGTAALRQRLAEVTGRAEQVTAEVWPAVHALVLGSA